MQIIHASPDGGNVDIYAAGSTQPLLSNVPYGAAGSLDVPPATYTFEVRAAGAASTAPAAYTSPAITVTAGGSYTAIACGLLNSTNEADRFRLLALEDGFSTPAADTILARITHAGSDAPAVGIDVDVDGTVDLADVGRFASSAAAGVPLPANQAIQIGVRTNEGALVASFTTPALPAGTTLSVIATGLLSAAAGDANGFGLLAVLKDQANTTVFIRQNARVQVIHASANAPSVDVYARGMASPLLTSVPYGAAATVAVPPGDYTLDIRPADAPSTDAPVVSQAVTLGAGKSYAAVAAGFVGGGADDALRILPIETALSAPSAGNAQVRVLHAGADAPTVDIDVGDDGSAELAGVDRFAAAPAAGVSLPGAQPLQIGIRAGGNKVTAFTTPQLGDGSQLWVIATGMLTRRPGAVDGFSLLAVFSNDNTAFIQQNPVVYALHASQGAPSVDIFAGDARVVTNITYPGAGGASLSAPVQVPPGDYTLDIFPTGDGTRPNGNPVYSVVANGLMAGGRYLAIATGILADATTPFTVLLVADDFAQPETGSAQARFVHAAPAVNAAVDVSTLSNTNMLNTPPVFADVGYGASSAGEGVSLPAQSFDLAVAAAGSTVPAAAFLDVALSGRAFAVAMGSSSPLGVGVVQTDTGAGAWTFAFVGQD